MGFPPRPDMPFMLVMAVCCSTSLLNRMKPNPLLNPLSSRTTGEEKFGNAKEKVFALGINEKGPRF